MATVFTRSIKVSLTTEGGTLSGPSITRTADGADDRTLTIAAGATNVQDRIALTVAKLQMVFLMATGGDLTIKTNSTSAPDNTIALKAGVPVYWASGVTSPANPLTVDVTTWYITNAGAASAQFDARVLWDTAI